ncbi:MAG: PD40 domain-containing protein [Anaerolineae bacterium]|nr:PD40 domain-containing protein [Anaerolineae bacterium]
MRHFILLLLLISIFSVLGSSSAQDSRPIIIENNDQYFTWNPNTGAATELLLGEVDRFSLQGSPTGEWAAYTRLAPVSISYLENYERGSGGLPNDVWLVNLETGETQAITEQPEDAFFYIENSRNVILRASITWSPDGSQIAWSEMDYYDLHLQQRHRIMVADIATGEVRTLVDSLPDYMGAIYPQTIQWIDSGILLSTTLASNQQDSFILYDAESGAQLQQISLGEGVHLVDYLVVKQGERDIVTVLPSVGEFSQIDLESGEMFSLLGLPMAVSESTQVKLVLSEDVSFPFQWEVTTSDGEIYLTSISRDFAQERFALSPDGQSVIFYPSQEPGTPSEDRHFLLWQDGELLDVPIFTEPIGGALRQAIRWSMPEWILNITPSDSSLCEGHLEPRLMVGEQAMVLPGDPNSLRWYPLDYANRIGAIPAEATFTVLSGPICKQDYNWWQVEYDGQIGWTAEGDLTTYWLEPLDE